jgi:hypothetical protein
MASFTQPALAGGPPHCPLVRACCAAACPLRRYASGDLYVGQWADDRRNGAGTLYMASGAAAGAAGGVGAAARAAAGVGARRAPWSCRAGCGTGLTHMADDQVLGAGCGAAGDIYIGNFLNDRREGMGTLYLMARQKKCAGGA